MTVWIAACLRCSFRNRIIQTLELMPLILRIPISPFFLSFTPFPSLSFFPFAVPSMRLSLYQLYNRIMDTILQIKLQQLVSWLALHAQEIKIAARSISRVKGILRDLTCTYRRKLFQLQCFIGNIIFQELIESPMKGNRRSPRKCPEIREAVRILGQEIQISTFGDRVEYHIAKFTQIARNLSARQTKFSPMKPFQASTSVKPKKRAFSYLDKFHEQMGRKQKVNTSTPIIGRRLKNKGLASTAEGYSQEDSLQKHQTRLKSRLPIHDDLERQLFPEGADWNILESKILFVAERESDRDSLEELSHQIGGLDDSLQQLNKANETGAFPSIPESDFQESFSFG